jgi:Aldehyde dehydrogenase family
MFGEALGPEDAAVAAGTAVNPTVPSSAAAPTPARVDHCVKVNVFSPSGWTASPPARTLRRGRTEIACGQPIGYPRSRPGGNPADNEQHAVEIANDTIYGLNSSVFTNDVDRARQVAGQLRAGTVGHNAFRTDFSVSFGGFKQSGIGREGGTEGLQPFLETKFVVLDGKPAGPYEGVVLDLFATVTRVWPDLYGPSLALCGPIWFVRQLGEEIGQPVTRMAGGLEVVHVRDVPVVGTTTLQTGPLGKFLAPDLLEGSCYPLPARCHPDLHPSGWRSLSLAVQEGLNPAAALAVAELGG